MSGATGDLQCWACNGPLNKTARAIMTRLGREPSFAELWARLDQAEGDRDRMLNALQLVRDAIERDRVNQHTLTIIYRALSRIRPVRNASPSPSPGGEVAR